MNVLGRLNRPVDIIEWAHIKDINLPENLADAVSSRGKNAIDFVTENVRLKARLRTLEERATSASLERPEPSSDKHLSVRERESMLKLILGMSMKGYYLRRPNPVQMITRKDLKIMPKFNIQNERIKRAYFTYLEEAKGKAPSSVDQVAAAIADFEKSTKYLDFKKFHIEQAKAFKSNLAKQLNKDAGKPLAIATIHSRLMNLKTFFHWLAGQSGYKSRISYSDCEYFNPSANDSRIAPASREMPYPTLEQVRHVLRLIPIDSEFQNRDRAIIATALLIGARDDALASLSIKYFDFENRQVFQDAKEVRTKRGKTMLTDFFPVGGDVEEIIKEWIEYLKTEKLFGPNDPAFPPSERGLDKNVLFTVTGFRHSHW